MIAIIVHADKFSEAVARPDVVHINYVRFDTAITDKYGIVCENWPLDQFRCPGDIRSRTELEVLKQAWISGTTKFRRLSPEELEAWQAARFETNMQITREQAASDSENQASQIPVVPLSPTPQEQPGPSFNTSVLAGTSTGPMVLNMSRGTFVAYKPRKPRKDKGKIRGPRKPKNTTA